MARFLRNIPKGPALQLRRGLWLLILITHLPAMLRISAALLSGQLESLSLIGSLGMTLSCAFFVLKIVDLECLRFAANLRSAVSLVLAVTLMHLNVLNLSEVELAEPQQTLVLSQLLLASNMVCVRSALRRAASWLRTESRIRAGEAALCSRICSALESAGPQYYSRTLIAPRAPPIAAIF